MPGAELPDTDQPSVGGQRQYADGLATGAPDHLPGGLAAVGEPVGASADRDPAPVDDLVVADHLPATFLVARGGFETCVGGESGSSGRSPISSAGSSPVDSVGSVGSVVDGAASAGESASAGASGSDFGFCFRFRLGRRRGAGEQVGQPAPLDAPELPGLAAGAVEHSDLEPSALTLRAGCRHARAVGARRSAAARSRPSE